MATAKKATDVKESTSVSNKTSTSTITQTEEKTAMETAIKKYEPDDMIPCRSNTVGLLLYNGHKTSLPYQWSNIGDVSYVAYQDILAAFMVNSSYIFDPLFIIEEDEVLADPRFIRIKKVYENLYDSDDLDKLLNLAPEKFKNVLLNSPVGLRNVVKNKIGGLVAENKFDSIRKIQIIDEMCGTDFCSLI